AHAFSAWVLSTLGDTKKAAAAARLAQELDPLSPVTNGIAGLVAYQARDFDLAIKAGERSLELDPTDFIGLFATSVSYAAAGKHEEAITYSERGVGLLPDSTFLLALLGAVNAMAGRKEVAEAILAKLQQRAGKAYVAPLLLAWIYANLGDADRAFDLLNQAYEEHTCTLGFGEWRVPMYDPIRGDPRFGMFLEKVGGLQ
ncbi:MAG: tetratricopeptide repeat protein, partial [Gemmatimonadales bacterium]